jgi:hypothetical protein
MSQRKFIAHQYGLTETGGRGKQVDTIEFSADPTYKEMLRVVEKRLEKRPVDGYEIEVYWAVGYTTGRKKAFSYKVQY